MLGFYKATPAWFVAITGAARFVVLKLEGWLARGKTFAFLEPLLPPVTLARFRRIFPLLVAPAGVLS